MKMNMKNLSLILYCALIFFVLSVEAGRRGRSRNGRRPKKSNEDPTIKFRQAVEKYKKLREEKMNSSLLSKREEINEIEEINRVNTLLLLGKHDQSHRSLFEIEGNNLIQNEYVLETVYDDSTPEKVTNNLIPDENRKMNFKMKVKTVIKTKKRTIKAFPPFRTKRLPSFSRWVNATIKKTTKKIPTTTIRKIYTTTTKKIPTTTIRKINTTTTKKINTTTIKKITTTKTIVATNNAVPVNSATNNNQIYQPKPGTKFQWQLSNCEKVNTSIDADVFDIDLFETPASKIRELKNKGKKVICYFSGGTIESWRDDAEDFLNKGVVLEEMEDWEDENWLNINSSKLKPLIQKRFNMAVEKGCDGVEIDNVDGYTFDENDFTYNQQLKFNKWLSEEAHKRNLSIGLKNDMDQIKDLLPHFDWALNEECYEYGECEKYKPFIQANKAVFGVSYITGSKKIADDCKKANELKLDYQIKNINLDASRIDCSVYK